MNHDKKIDPAETLDGVPENAAEPARCEIAQEMKLRLELSPENEGSTDLTQVPASSSA